MHAWLVPNPCLTQASYWHQPLHPVVRAFWNSRDKAVFAFDLFSETLVSFSSIVWLNIVYGKKFRTRRMGAAVTVVVLGFLIGRIIEVAGVMKFDIPLNPSYFLYYSEGVVHWATPYTVASFVVFISVLATQLDLWSLKAKLGFVGLNLAIVFFMRFCVLTLRNRLMAQFPCVCNKSSMLTLFALTTALATAVCRSLSNHLRLASPASAYFLPLQTIVFGSLFVRTLQASQGFEEQFHSAVNNHPIASAFVLPSLTQNFVCSGCHFSPSSKYVTSSVLVLSDVDTDEH